MSRSTGETERALTLLEVLIGLTIGLIVMTAAASMLSYSVQRGERGRVRAGLARDAVFAARLMSLELRQAGAGVPSGVHVQQACPGGGAACVFLYGAARPARFASSVIRADAAQVGVVGDLPFHDSSFPTFGLLNRRPTGRTDSIWWHTENNGLGGVGESATGPFFAGETVCGTAAARTCPWGLGRLEANDRVQIVAGNQNWSHSAASDPIGTIAAQPPGQTAGMQLAFPFDFSTPDLVWPNTAYELPPMGLRGAGWVTTLDRVFFRRTGSTLERIQCTGDVDPTHASWGAPVDLTPSSSGPPTAANTCDPPEVIARAVVDVAFSYFTRTGAATAVLRDIARIDFLLVLEAPLSNGSTVTYEQRGSVRLPAA